MRTVCRGNVGFLVKMRAHLGRLYESYFLFLSNSRTSKLLKNLKDLNFIFIKDLEEILCLTIGHGG